MGFHNKLNCNDTLLLDKTCCPCCKAKGTLRYFRHADILALNQTVVCDLCGRAYSKIIVNKNEQVIEYKMVGLWKYQFNTALSVCGNTIEGASVYFESLEEPL